MAIIETVECRFEGRDYPISINKSEYDANPEKYKLFKEEKAVKEEKKAVSKEIKSKKRGRKPYMNDTTKKIMGEN